MIRKFSFEKTKLEGIILITPFRVDDERGNFIKDFSQKVFFENGINETLKEIFYTTSKKGVIRAMHFQTTIQQSKIVRCIKGKIFDVVADIRLESKTFGQWQAFELNEDNNRELYIPKGFAHGFLVIEDAIVSYKCGEDFYSEYDDGIKWNDIDLAIEWPIHLVEKVVLSQKDECLQTLQEYIKRIRK